MTVARSMNQIVDVRKTQGSEPSKYLQEKKSNEIPQVAASERGGAQTGGARIVGVVGRVRGNPVRSESTAAVEGSGKARQRG